MTDLFWVDELGDEKSSRKTGAMIKPNSWEEEPGNECTCCAGTGEGVADGTYCVCCNGKGYIVLRREA